MNESKERLRVDVRGYDPKYVEDVCELFLAPRCCWGTLQIPYQERGALRKKLAEPPPGLHRLIAVDPETNKAVGLLGIHAQSGRRAHVAMLGMFVHDDYHNRGVGSALMEAMIDRCDNWLNLSRLELSVYIDNEPARRLYEKYGFVVEGRMKKFAFRDGAFVDSIMMARVR